VGAVTDDTALEFPRNISMDKKISLLGGSPGGASVRRTATYFICTKDNGKIKAVKIGKSMHGDAAVRRRIKTLRIPGHKRWQS
jgi:hypothetical protein